MNTYKKYLLGAALILTATQAVPAKASADINLNFGPTVAVAAVQPPPPPAYRGTPEFFYSPSLGVYVSVNTPNEIFFIDGKYYRYNGHFWGRSSKIDGKGKLMNVSRLPKGLARHSYDEICRLRDRDYRHYMDGRRDHRNDRDDNRGDWRDRDRDRNEHGGDGRDR